jgi:hypothetical protein
VLAKECAAHTDVKTAAAARRAARHGARTKRQRELKRVRRAGCARGGVGSGTSKRLLPSLARRPASHSAMVRWRSGDTTRRSRMTAILARRPGATGVRHEQALTYGLRNHKVKAAVMKSLVRRRGCRQRWQRKQRRHGVGVRGFSASRDSTGGLRLPRRHGRLSLSRLLLLLFPSSSPPPVHGGADGDETPRRLGLGAQGGAVAAYL